MAPRFGKIMRFRFLIYLIALTLGFWFICIKNHKFEINSIFTLANKKPTTNCSPENLILASTFWDWF